MSQKKNKSGRQLLVLVGVVGLSGAMLAAAPAMAQPQAAAAKNSDVAKTLWVYGSGSDAITFLNNKWAYMGVYSKKVPKCKKETYKKAWKKGCATYKAFRSKGSWKLNIIDISKGKKQLHSQTGENLKKTNVLGFSNDGSLTKYFYRYKPLKKGKTLSGHWKYEKSNGTTMRSIFIKKGKKYLIAPEGKYLSYIRKTDGYGTVSDATAWKRAPNKYKGTYTVLKGGKIKLKPKGKKAKSYLLNVVFDFGKSGSWNSFMLNNQYWAPPY